MEDLELIDGLLGGILKGPERRLGLRAGCTYERVVGDGSGGAIASLDRHSLLLLVDAGRCTDDELEPIGRIGFEVVCEGIKKLGDWDLVGARDGPRRCDLVEELVGGRDEGDLVLLVLVDAFQLGDGVFDEIVSSAEACEAGADNDEVVDCHGQQENDGSTGKERSRIGLITAAFSNLKRRSRQWR